MQKANTSSKSGNTYTFVYLTLGREINKNTKPYVCQCSECDFSRYAKFMKYMNNKENTPPPTPKESLFKRKSCVSL